MKCRKSGYKNNEDSNHYEKCKINSDTTKKIVEKIILFAALLICLCVVCIYFDPKRERISLYETAMEDNKTYELRDVFEIQKVAFDFKETFSGKRYMVNDFIGWEANEGTICSGYKGLVENRSENYIDLSNMEASIYYTDNAGNKKKSENPYIRCYTNEMLADYQNTSGSSSINLLAPGKQAEIYIFGTPDENYETTEMILTVYGDFGLKGKEHKVIVKNSSRYGNNYSDTDASGYLLDARRYCEGLSSIQFLKDEIKYNGYIDKEGNLKFYFRAVSPSGDTERGSNFENGYARSVYDGKSYVFDKQGIVTSSYEEENIVTYNSGYTWIEEDNSGFDKVEYVYTLYDPDGNEETSFICEDDEGSWIYSLGEGVFCYKTGRFWDEWDEDVGEYFYCYDYYFTKSHKWVEDICSFEDMEEIKFEDGTLVCFSGEEKDGYYITIFDNEGIYRHIRIPDDLIIPHSYYDDDVPIVRGYSGNYVLLEAENNWYYVYDIANDNFIKYTGDYEEQVHFKGPWSNGYGTPEIEGNTLVIMLEGMDGEDYVEMVHLPTMETIGEPVRADEFSIMNQFLLTSITVDDSEEIYETSIYNTNMELICTTQDDVSWKFGNEAIVKKTRGQDDVLEYEYLDNTGKALFDKINYRVGKEIDL